MPIIITPGFVIVREESWGKEVIRQWLNSEELGSRRRIPFGGGTQESF